MIDLAGTPVELSTAYDTYAPYFAPYLWQGPAPLPVERVSVTRERLRRAAAIYPPNAPEDYVEYMELCPRASAAVLPAGRVIFHGVAFLWRERAWLLTAPSGTGKSTQYCLWKLLFPDEVQIINGDKPVVYLERGEAWVTSSPWAGKEGMSRRLHAPLGGIVWLQQAPENGMQRLSIHQCAGRLFTQFLFDCQEPAQVHAACRIEERMLRSPVWLLKNRGDAESARLCRRTLEAYLAENDTKREEAGEHHE